MSLTEVHDPVRLKRVLESAELGAAIADDDRAFCADLDSWRRNHAEAELSSADLLQLEADLTYLQAYFAYVDGDADQSFELYTAAVELTERSGDTARLVACLRGLAICHEYAGRQAESVDVVFRALELAEQLDEPRVLTRALSGLLVLYESQGAHLPALETAMRIRELAVETNDSLLLATAACYAGLFCGYLGRADEGLEWIAQGFQITEGTDFDQIRTYLSLYEFFLLHVAGRFEEAVTAAEAQLETIAALPAQNAAATYVDVAEIYVSAGRLARASEMLRLAEKAAQSDQLNAHLLRYYEVAADLHEARGETAVALRMLRLHMQLHEEIRGQQARVRLVTVERHFASELAEKTRELNELRTVELVAKNEQLAELNHQKDEILNVVAHDLRSPLAAAQMLSESMLLDADSDIDDDRDQQIRAIRAATSEMGATIDTLLHLQHGDSPRISIPVDAAVRRSVSWIDDPAAERDVAVTIEIDPIDHEVDGALLRRALDDILWMCLQAADAGGSLSVCAAPTAGGATITIASQPPITDSYDRALYIARRLVERMNGSITVSTRHRHSGPESVAVIELR